MPAPVLLRPAPTPWIVALALANLLSVTAKALSASSLVIPVARSSQPLSSASAQAQRGREPAVADQLPLSGRGRASHVAPRYRGVLLLSKLGGQQLDSVKQLDDRLGQRVRQRRASQRLRRLLS